MIYAGWFLGGMLFGAVVAFVVIALCQAASVDDLHRQNRQW